jgi:hypothetical protein
MFSHCRPIGSIVVFKSGVYVTIVVPSVVTDGGVFVTFCDFAQLNKVITIKMAKNLIFFFKSSLERNQNCTKSYLLYKLISFMIH